MSLGLELGGPAWGRGYKEGVTNMAVFISYSHADKEKIDKIAGHLVRKRASVWVDRWELKPGDSLINRIQEAVEGSSALLIMLSPASVDSGWCKRELTAGLLRELEEKRVVTIPVLLEDCNIPLFLRDKMYADFRTDFDAGMNALLEAVAGHANPDQSRIEDVDGYLDWSTDWGGSRWAYRYQLYVGAELFEYRNDLPYADILRIGGCGICQISTVSGTWYRLDVPDYSRSFIARTRKGQ